MKQLLKSLKKPPPYKLKQSSHALAQSSVGLHPSLKRDIEDGNVKMLEALINLEEKEVKKVPNMVLNAP